MFVAYNMLGFLTIFNATFRKLGKVNRTHCIGIRNEFIEYLTTYEHVYEINYDD